MPVGYSLPRFVDTLVRCAGARQATAATVQQLFGGTPQSSGPVTSGAAPDFDRALWETLAKPRGLLGLLIPGRYGGCGGCLADLAVLFHALGASCAALPVFGHTAVAGQAILAGGNEVQRVEWLPRIARGEIIASDGYCPDLSVHSGKLSGVANSVPHGRHADLLVVSNDHATWLVETADRRVEIQFGTEADPVRPLDRAIFNGAPAIPLSDHAGASEALHKAGFLALAAEALGGADAAADRILAMQLLKPSDHRITAVPGARLSVLFAAEPVRRDPILGRIAFHQAKARASTAYLALAEHLALIRGADDPLASLHLAHARGFDAIMGPSSWHLAEIARLLAGLSGESATGKIAHAS